MRELELNDEDELKTFLTNCAECDLISSETLEMGHVVSRGVSEQIDYYKTKSEIGKKAAAGRWKGKNKADA